MPYIKIDNDTVVTESGQEYRRMPPSPHWQAYQDWLAAGNEPKRPPKELPLVTKDVRELPVKFYYRFHDRCAYTDAGLCVVPTQQTDQWAAYEAWLADGNTPQERFTPEQWEALNQNSKARLGLVAPG